MAVVCVRAVMLVVDVRQAGAGGAAAEELFDLGAVEVDVGAAGEVVDLEHSQQFIEHSLRWAVVAERSGVAHR